MRARFILTTMGALALSASAVQAQVIVLGNGVGRQCWMAAEYSKGNMNEGFNVCTQALAQPGGSLRDRAATYTNRSVIRMRAGDYAGALGDAEASIKVMPRLGEAHINRGAALLNLMQSTEALAAINRGFELGTSRLHVAYYDRGVAKEILGDIRGAYNDYKASVAEKPDFALAAQQLTRFSVVKRAASATFDGNDETVVALKTPRAFPPRGAE